MSDTSVNKNQYTFTWLIDDFNFYDTYRFCGENEIRSPMFTTEHFTQASSWFLALRVKFTSKFAAKCFLVRYSEDEIADIIRIQWQLKITFSNDDGSIKSMKDDLIIDAFKKGYSREGCEFIGKSENAYLLKCITLQCQMMEYLSVEKPIFMSSTVRTKAKRFIWVPQSLLETKLLPGPQGILYETSFDVSDKNISIKIRRSDSNSLVQGFLFCGLKMQNILLSIRKDRLIKPFKINDTFQILSSRKTNEFPNSEFSFNVKIEGITSVSILVDDQSSKFDDKPEEITAKIPTHKLDSMDILKRDQLRMYEDRIHCDMKLQIRSELFPVHKCILASRSPVFSAMFGQNMIENQTGIVNIRDMDSSTLNLLLKYLYTYTVDEIHCESALKLLLAADKYRILSLKEECCTYLLNALSEENVCEILAAADMISLQNLKSSAMDYVKAHGKVLVSDGWKQLVTNNINLAAETLSKISIDFEASHGKTSK